MRLLLDSNVLVRVSRGLAGSRLRVLISDPTHTLVVSIASIWELAVKEAKHGLGLPDDFADGLETRGCVLLPITARHAWSVARLPYLHGDPFDRLLVAQALAEDLTLVTSDHLLAGYGVAMILA